MLSNFESLGFIKTKILPFAIVALFGIASSQLVQEFGCQRYDVPCPYQLMFLVLKMTKNKDTSKESLAEIAVDPDVLAKNWFLEIEIDPLEQIDKDAFQKV